MSAGATKLSLILGRTAGGGFGLWACRGEGKGCERNRYRTRKKPCDDCDGPLPDDMTIGDVEERLKRGDG